MNRRKFFRSSSLAALSAMVLQNKLRAFGLPATFSKHLLIDLGSVRFQDVISDPKKSAMPHLLRLISSGQMILHTFDHSELSKKNPHRSFSNTNQFYLNSFAPESLKPEINFYDSFLIQKAFESAVHSPQNLYVRIHQTEMAHYNIPAYRSLLVQIDQVIINNLKNFALSGLQVHIYSSSGRNLYPDEYGGLHHHDSDKNCEKTFYIQSNPTS